MQYRQRTVISIAILVASFTPRAALGQTIGDIRGTVADASGVYRFPAVPPGTYVLAATLTGFARFERTNVHVRLSEAVVVPVTLRISRSDEVVVTGEAPAVDTASTTAGSNYAVSVIEKLPLGRNSADVPRLQPGVQEDNGETQGRSLALSVYGSTSAENLFPVHGVNTTNVIKGFQGKAINSKLVHAVEVRTGGYQAEYGRNTGDVVNVVTRQGGRVPRQRLRILREPGHPGRGGTSLSSRERASGSRESSSGRTLTATSRPSRVSRAR